jgi:hypothetical protein
MTDPLLQLDVIKARHEAFLAVAPGIGIFLQAEGSPKAVAQFLEHSSADIGWLIAKVERLQHARDELAISSELGWRRYDRLYAQREDADAEIKHLRGRLRQLEGLGSPDGDKACPVCYANANSPDIHHEPDCWLAAELAKEIQ